MRPSISLPRSRPRRLAVELVVLAVIFSFGGFAGPALAAQVQQVIVTNTSSSPVPVAGTVNVGNLPGTQPVSGTVSVGNFPATQNVNVTGGSISASQPVSTVMQSTGFHAVAFAADDVLNLGASGLNVTAIVIDDGLSEDDTWRAHVFGGNGGAVKVASASGNLFLSFPVPVFASSIHVQCLDAAGCFWNLAVMGYPTS